MGRLRPHLVKEATRAITRANPGVSHLIFTLSVLAMRSGFDHLELMVEADSAQYTEPAHLYLPPLVSASQQEREWCILDLYKRGGGLFSCIWRREGWLLVR